MSDYKSGLPIRTEADGTDERLHAKIVDGVDPSKRMTVDADLNAHVEMHGNDPAGLDHALILSEEGRLVPRGDYDAVTNSKPGSVALIAHARNAAPTEAQQTFRPTGVQGSALNTVWAMDIALHDENGDAFSDTNPLPVSISQSEGSEVNDYATSSALAVNASANHDYTVTALKTLRLSQIVASGSGKIKAEIKLETAAASGVYNTKWVLFNSTANPNIILNLSEFFSQVAGAKVRVTITNYDNQAQDVYSTISGHEI